MILIKTVGFVSSLCTFIYFVGSLRYDDTCLPDLGLRINQTLANPWGTTDQLIRDIYVYFEELDGIRKGIRKCLEEGLDPKTELCHEYRKFEQVNETGGPIHIQSNVRIRTLIDFYKWGSDEIYEFYELIQFTRKAWKKLLALLSGEKKPVFTIQDKVKQYLQKGYVKKRV